MPSQTHASVYDKLKAIANMSSALASAVGAALDYETVRVKINYAAYVKRTYTRSLLHLCTPVQLQWIYNSSSKAYRKWIKKNGASESMQVKTDVLSEDGAKLHWIGNENAEKVILYIHGNGFVTPLNENHITFMNFLRLRLKIDSKINVRVAFLEYALAPSAHFPTQLRQAAQALHHLFASKIPPSNILLAGDSAGGLLLFQLLSHLLHPCPLVERISIPTTGTGTGTSSTQFAGILAVSPWICPDEDYVERNFNGRANQGIVDFVPPKAVNSWSSLIKTQQRSDLPTSPTSISEKRESHEVKLPSSEATSLSDLDVDNWQQPYNAPLEWWRDTYKYTSHILITRGTKELMAQDIEQFGEDLNRAFRGTKVGARVISQMDGIHCGPLLAPLLGADEDDGEFLEDIVEWISDQFSKTRANVIGS